MLLWKSMSILFEIDVWLRTYSLHTITKHAQFSIFMFYYFSFFYSSVIFFFHFLFFFSLSFTVFFCSNVSKIYHENGIVWYYSYNDWHIHLFFFVIFISSVSHMWKINCNQKLNVVHCKIIRWFDFSVSLSAIYLRCINNCAVVTIKFL